MLVVGGATDPVDSRGRKRSQRAAARAAIDHDSTTSTYLRTRSITDATKATYHDAFWNFADFSARGGHARSTPATADAVLELYFDKLFFDGENPHVGETTIAALGFYMRWSTKGCFPRARRALRGWRVIVPDRARDPIPWESVLLIVEALLDDSDDMAPFAACALMIQFDCYFRPGECLRISKAGVFPPRGNSRLYKDWAITAAPITAGRPSKTGIYDDTVTVGSINPARAWIVDIVSLLYHFNSNDATLFRDLALHDLERFMKTAARSAGLAALKPVPHMCRHRGPSTDMLANVTDLATIQARGRWGCIESVRRYEKHAKLLRTAKQLTTQQLNRAALLSDGQSILRRLRVRMAGILKSKGKNKLAILLKQGKIKG